MTPITKSAAMALRIKEARRDLAHWLDCLKQPHAIGMYRNILLRRVRKCTERIRRWEDRMSET